MAIRREPGRLESQLPGSHAPAWGVERMRPIQRNPAHWRVDGDANHHGSVWDQGESKKEMDRIDFMRWIIRRLGDGSNIFST